MPVTPRRAARVGIAPVVLLAALLAGCGDESPTVQDELTERAAAGLAQSYTATYSLDTGAAEPTTATVAREPGRVRIDVHTADGVATSIRDAERTVSCQTASDGQATCLVVAGPDQPVDPAFEPSLRRLFDEMLGVFAEVPESLDVSDAGTAEVPAAGQDVRCFRVGGDPPPPVAAGTYCLTADGVPAQVTYEASTATLTELAEAPGAATFSPPASPTPLPTT